jgi:hypothetical protein
MTAQAGAASLAYDVMEAFWSSASTSDLARRQGRDAWREALPLRWIASSGSGACLGR